MIYDMKFMNVTFGSYCTLLDSKKKDKTLKSCKLYFDGSEEKGNVDIKCDTDEQADKIRELSGVILKSY